MLRLPTARGEVSDRLLRELAREVHRFSLPSLAATDDPLADEDLHLSLYLGYELHYRGLPGVDERWEWDPGLLELRSRLEDQFERGLLDAVPREGTVPPPEEIDVALHEIAEADDGPSLSMHLERQGTLDQFLEFVVHRSAYNLKEADPHSWAIPRLGGKAKAALIEIQADEYGGGRPERVHAQLFADTMDALGLDSRYGAYVEHIPGITLATVNLMSMLGLHRRWRGAIIGHLALFEITSPVPNRRYGNGLRRLGFEGEATEFYDEHVEADAVHESIASIDLAGGLARQDPAVAGDVLWGARALDELEGRFGVHLLAAWEAGETSLRVGLEAPAPA